MQFKKGDKLLCIRASEMLPDLIKGNVYTCTAYYDDEHSKVDLEKTNGQNKKGWNSDRFILATELNIALT